EAHGAALDAQRTHHVGLDDAAPGAGHLHGPEGGEHGFAGHGHSAAVRISGGLAFAGPATDVGAGAAAARGRVTSTARAARPASAAPVSAGRAPATSMSPPSAKAPTAE